MLLQCGGGWRREGDVTVGCEGKLDDVHRGVTAEKNIKGPISCKLSYFVSHCRCLWSCQVSLSIYQTLDLHETQHVALCLPSQYKKKTGFSISVSWTADNTSNNRQEALWEVLGVASARYQCPL